MDANKIILVILVLTIFLQSSGYAQTDLVEVPIVIQNNNYNNKKILYPAPHDNFFLFYKEGELVHKENYSYKPYYITYNQRCIDYFKLGEVDSVVMIFYANGIFNGNYEYRIGLNKSINFFDSDASFFYELSITDIVNTEKNIRLIKDLKAPYLYSFSKSHSYMTLIHHNWAQIGEKVTFKNPKKRRDNVLSDYENYRANFWK